MMKNTLCIGGLALLLLISGCIQVELKDEREIPLFYEIALVTHTPSVQISEQPTLTPSSAPTATSMTHPSPTSTATATQTDLPPSPTAIPSAEVIMNTYCRKGPGSNYPGVVLIKTGEQVALLGRNAVSTWWLVQYRDDLESCWISASLVIMQGDYPELAVVSAPPTPYPRISPDAAPTQKPRPKPPIATQEVEPTPTDTPDPYPYPPP